MQNVLAQMWGLRYLYGLYFRDKLDLLFQNYSLIIIQNLFVNDLFSKYLVFQKERKEKKKSRFSKSIWEFSILDIYFCPFLTFQKQVWEKDDFLLKKKHYDEYDQAFYWKDFLLLTEKFRRLKFQ
jgi:hypothetical protein